MFQCKFTIPFKTTRLGFRNKTIKINAIFSTQEQEMQTIKTKELFSQLLLKKQTNKKKKHDVCRNSVFSPQLSTSAKTEICCHLKRSERHVWFGTRRSRFSCYSWPISGRTSLREMFDSTFVCTPPLYSLFSELQNVLKYGAVVFAKQAIWDTHCLAFYK